MTSIRAARGPSSTSQGSGAYVPPAAAVVNPDYVQCPHCERRFNEHSAQRHIEFCKEQKSRIPSKKAGAENLTKLSKRTQVRLRLLLTFCTISYSTRVKISQAITELLSQQPCNNTEYCIQPGESTGVVRVC